MPTYSAKSTGFSSPTHVHRKGMSLTTVHSRTAGWPIPRVHRASWCRWSWPQSRGQSHCLQSLGTSLGMDPVPQGKTGWLSTHNMASIGSPSSTNCACETTGLKKRGQWPQRYNYRALKVRQWPYKYDYQALKKQVMTAQLQPPGLNEAGGCRGPLHATMCGCSPVSQVGTQNCHLQQ